IGGLIVGLIFGLIFGLIVGLIGGLIVGLIFGLIVGLIVGLKAEIKIRTKPNQGIWLSRNKAVLIWFLSIFPTICIFVLPNLILGQELQWLNSAIRGFFGSTIFGLYGGGFACIQHFSLRYVLQHQGNIPRNYSDFLNYMQDRKIIKITEGHYRFYHDLLREHLAGELEPVNSISQPQTTNTFGFVESIIVLALAVLLFIFINTTRFSPDSVTAMSPLIQTNDVMLCDRIFYRLRLRPIERGDIAIFATREGFKDKEFPNQFATRRIIALPNETIEIKQGKVYINGNVRDEDYLSPPDSYQQEPLQLPGDAYYFIGNNPDYSDRDLFGGIVPRKNIRGEVLLRIAPLNRFGLID
ncbi:MAG: signal peptidase I, partial [Cyanobacteria bacterium SBLK]|nr:signal peptidase I [Cyanobacteria bacterium SBLK]